MSRPSTSRRRFMAAAALLPGAAVAAGAPPHVARGIEGQRRADLGNGTYLNPIVPGDHPDPTILKDGADYYMTFSSCQLSPGVVIWHSTDLVNWAPITAALTQPLGTVWAMDLVKHQGRYFIYMPVLQPGRTAIYVIHATDMRGPWSEPVDLHIDGCIDPGHAVGEDGRRYLFLNGVRRIRLTDDGLATDGPLEHAYTPWRYPDDWVVEMFAPEGPKILRRGAWFYLIAAVGGTSGPPTSHMVTVARSKSIHGPWENDPHNPIVRTQSAAEPWWSRGHASVVEGPAGDWWMVYHGYENGYRTLGRQVLLEPIEWTRDGWFRARGGTLDRPLPKPRGGQPGPGGMALSDDFSRNRLGVQWQFFDPRPEDLQRVRYEPGSLVLGAKGTSLADCTPLLCTAGDRSYEVQVDLEPLGDEVQAGLALFYDARGHVGVGFGGGAMHTYHVGEVVPWMRREVPGRRYRLKLTNHEQVVTFHYAVDGGRWVKYEWQREVSGFHHNVFNGFLALRIALFAAGRGEVRLSNFLYRALA